MRMLSPWDPWLTFPRNSSRTRGSKNVRNMGRNSATQFHFAYRKAPDCWAITPRSRVIENRGTFPEWNRFLVSKAKSAENTC